jgi:4-hydroxyphenylpyruvate dioxygenase
VLWTDPCRGGTAGDVQALAQLFERMGFRAIARHDSKQVVLYRQG